MVTCPILEEKYDKTEEKGCQWERRELATGPRGPNQCSTAGAEGPWPILPCRDERRTG